MVALGYIHNESRRFHTFVANRVTNIRDRTEKTQWRYVQSSENPADLASRGVSPKDEEKIRTWFHGPEFLWQPEADWDKATPIKETSDDDLEIKQSITVNVVKFNPTCTLTRLEERCHWTRMVRVLALVFKFIQRCRKTKDKTIKLSVADLKRGEVALLKMIQERDLAMELRHYHTETNMLRPTKKEERKLNIWRLDPYVDQYGILRVGGRLRKSLLNDTIKHPVILPKHGIATQRLIEHYHQCTQHGGRTATINALRCAGYWVISVNTRVRHIIHHCILCRKFRGRLGEQKWLIYQLSEQ